MTLEIILTVLGVLTALIGIWNLYIGALVWGILFLIGGIWAIWLGVVYILQIKRSRMNKITGDKAAGTAKTAGSAKKNQKTQKKAEAAKADVSRKTGEPAGSDQKSGGNIPISDGRLSDDDQAEHGKNDESMYADYGIESVESAVVSDEEDDYQMSSTDEAVDTEVVTDQMIFEEFLTDHFTGRQTETPEQPEEIDPEVIIDDPEPVVSFAEAEFVEEETEDKQD
ncbi:MAG: hypothetical protein ACOYB8_05665 [Eubacteriaceae bacterium]